MEKLLRECAERSRMDRNEPLGVICTCDGEGRSISGVHI